MTERDRKGIPSLWFKGVSPGDREARTELLRGSHIQFDTMRDLIRDMYRKTQAESDDFRNAGWPYQRAASDGYKQALRDIYNLIPQTKR